MVVKPKRPKAVTLTANEGGFLSVEGVVVGSVWWENRAGLHVTVYGFERRQNRSLYVLWKSVANGIEGSWRVDEFKRGFTPRP